MTRLENKVALVTGASRGIGRAVARNLAHQGAFVVVHANRSMEAAADLVHEIESAGGRAAILQADLSQEHGPLNLCEHLDALLRARLGSPNLDILINNAGVSKREPIEEVTPAQFDFTIMVNLRSPFFLIQQILPKLRDYGRIINVSSMGARTAFPKMAAYAPSKAGLEALTRLLAAHLGPRGITVNAVCPGRTFTTMNPSDPDSEEVKQTIDTIALGRIGQPCDVADVVAFLAGKEARWVTAQCIEVSGGQRI